MPRDAETTARTRTKTKSKAKLEKKLKAEMAGDRRATPQGGPAASASDGAAASKPYVPDEAEQAALERQIERLRTAPAAPRVKVAKTNGSYRVAVEHRDEKAAFGLLAEAFGTSDQHFVSGILMQLARMSERQGRVDETEFALLLSIVKDVKPRDQTEATLAVQMAVTHQAIMALALRLRNVETLQQQDSAANALTKLQRTYTMQMEALKRYRTGGEQKVTVQHVTVNEGGQAVVGQVNQARGSPAPAPPVRRSKPAALTHTPQEPMPILDAEPVREAVPHGTTRGKKPNG